jgi:hypothetical protein
MNTVIADITTPNASQLGIWILCALVALDLFAKAGSLLKFARNDAEKREVTINGEVAGKAEFNDHVRRNQSEHDQLHTKLGSSERETRRQIEQRIDQLRQERSRDMESLNAQIVEIAKSVSGVETASDLQNQRLAQMDGKLDRLVERHN